MQVLIKKCPNSAYLERGTFSCSQLEFGLIQDRPKDVVIEIYTEDNTLFKTLKGRDIKKLVATPRHKVSDDGSFGSPFYVVDFNGVR